MLDERLALELHHLTSPALKAPALVPSQRQHRSLRGGIPLNRLNISLHTTFRGT